MVVQRRLATTAASLATLACLTAPAIGAPAQHAGSAPFERPARVDFVDEQVYGVTIRSASDAWAVGRSPGGPVAWHWDGASWQRSTAPGRQAEALLAVAAASGGDVWAVGRGTYHSRPMIDRWDGQGWSRQNIGPVPGTYPELYGVDAGSADDAWAVGDYVTGRFSHRRPLAERWDGTSWSRTALPRLPVENGLSAVSSTSATDVWAVGWMYDVSEGRSLMMSVHWDGTSWTEVPVPNPEKGDPYLYDVTAIDESDAWAVGTVYSGKQDQRSIPLIEHWDGTAWKAATVAPLKRAALESVAASSATDVWAVGYEIPAAGKTLIEHWDGTSWARVASPSPGRDANELTAVDVDGPTDAWAVGNRLGGPLSTEFLHWDGSHWRAYHNEPALK